MSAVTAESAKPFDLVDDIGSRTKGPMSHPLEAVHFGQPGRKAHASPIVRALARHLGVDLNSVNGSGANARVLVEDVQGYVRSALADIASGSYAPSPRGGGTGSAGSDSVPMSLPAWPSIDFAKFGEVEAKPLSRIRRISGANFARNWMMIPHVTQHDDADITLLETFREQVNRENVKGGTEVMMLAFLIKAVVVALKRFPDFNTSIDGDQLVQKHYFHIGFAADTPAGPVVPVIRNADRKGVSQIAGESSAMAALAREGKLEPADMQGGCFSISSLGGKGGTYFTPIINAPEVAILGVSKEQIKPVWDGAAFVPKLMLPLSLSYDHRVIDGAAAARFTTFVGSVLADFRRVLM